MKRGKCSEMKNAVLHGDCLELMPRISDKSCDMILCDLPYGMTSCKWDTVIPFEPLWKEYKRVIKDRGAILLFGTEPFSSSLRLSNIKMYKYDWYWNKVNPTGFLFCKKQPLRSIEIISVFYKKFPTYNPQMTPRTKDDIKRQCYKSTLKNKTSEVWNAPYKKICNRDEMKFKYPKNILKFNAIHNSGKEKLPIPTQKPVALFEYLIKTYTNEGDLILDNCAGSGTTAIACMNTNRDYILMEKEQKYIDVINKRIAEHKQQLKLKLDET